MLGANIFKSPLMAKAGLSVFCLVFTLTSCATATTGGAIAPVSHVAPQRAAEPEWTRTGVHARFSSFMYLTAVGHGSSLQAAEMDAFRQLVSRFGVTVQADIRLAEAYRQTGAVARHDIDFGSEIILGAGMDNLIGAEIGDRWNDGRGSHSALAVLNRARATQVYTEMIRANQELIANLTNLSSAERNSLNGLSRHQFAAVIADMNAGYAAVLHEVGAPRPQGLRSGDDFRREAQQIAAAIPIGINIRTGNDRAGRVQSAFARSFSDLGFRTGGLNPQYVLNVDIIVEQTQHTGPHVFARMELSANLVDARTGVVLLPYAFNEREGHANLPEAENRVFIRAEQRINREYGAMLAEYLSQLLPRW